VEINKLVNVYIKMRDKKDEIRKEMEAQIADIDAKMDKVSQVLLNHMESTGADGLKTAYGTVSKSVTHRFWAPDWDQFREFVEEYGSLDLFERRIHQGNMRAFMEENPELTPPINSDSKVTVRVTRSRQ